MSNAIFERLSIRERGHFSNHFTVNPVCRLEFQFSSLVITRRFGNSEQPYDELSAELLNTYTAKGYGKGSYAYIPQTLVTIQGHGFSCRFDASRQFPDFKNSADLQHAIKSNIDTSVRIESLASVKHRHMVQCGVFFFALILVTWLARSHGI